MWIYLRSTCLGVMVLLVLGLSHAEEKSFVRGQNDGGRVISFTSMEEEAVAQERKGGAGKAKTLSVNDDFPGLLGAMKQQMGIGDISDDEEDEEEIAEYGEGGEASASSSVDNKNVGGNDDEADSDDEAGDAKPGGEDDGFEVMTPDEVASAEEESKKAANDNFSPPSIDDDYRGDGDDSARAAEDIEVDSSSSSSSKQGEYDLDVVNDEPVRGLPEGEQDVDNNAAPGGKAKDDNTVDDVEEEIDASIRRVLTSHFPEQDNTVTALNEDDSVVDALVDVNNVDLPTCSLSSDGTKSCRNADSRAASSPPQIDLSDLLNLEEKEAKEANAELFPPSSQNGKQRQLQEERDDPFMDPPPVSFGGKLCDTLEASPHIENAAWRLEEDESPRLEEENDPPAKEQQVGGIEASPPRKLKGHDMPLALLIARSPKTQMTGPLLATLPLLTSSTKADDTQTKGYKSCQAACVENLKCSAFSLVAILEDEGRGKGRAKCQLYSSATGATPCPQGQCASGILCDRAE